MSDPDSDASDVLQRRASASPPRARPARLATGIAGLDEILHGGWLAERAYVVSGSAGTGKTIVGLHFLSAGLSAGEPALFIGFDQPEDSVRADAESLGLDLQGCSFLDLTPGADEFGNGGAYDIFSPAEVERAPIARLISEKIRSLRPQRIFIDGFSQFRHLAADPFHLRRMIQSCFRVATESGATLLVSCEGPDSWCERDVNGVADGALLLVFSGGVRWLSVLKFRGSSFQGGMHTLRLTGSGAAVLPAES